jgi:D-tyrosyl-tRNA(Tyr) deacylase
MKVVIQRSKYAKVVVEDQIVGEIDSGLVVLVGIAEGDGEDDVRYMADKVMNLRIFDDEQGKMNYSLRDVGKNLLSISQFTLYGDVRKGRRPNFLLAASPQEAIPLYNLFNECMQKSGIHVETGVFGAMMEVHLVNDGPVTLIIESNEKR